MLAFGKVELLYWNRDECVALVLRGAQSPQRQGAGQQIDQNEECTKGLSSRTECKSDQPHMLCRRVRTLGREGLWRERTLSQSLCRPRLRGRRTRLPASLWSSCIHCWRSWGSYHIGRCRAARWPTAPTSPSAKRPRGGSAVVRVVARTPHANKGVRTEPPVPHTQV